MPDVWVEAIRTAATTILTRSSLSEFSVQDGAEMRVVRGGNAQIRVDSGPWEDFGSDESHLIKNVVTLLRSGRLGHVTCTKRHSTHALPQPSETDTRSKCFKSSHTGAQEVTTEADGDGDSDHKKKAFLDSLLRRLEQQIFSPNREALELEEHTKAFRLVRSQTSDAYEGMISYFVSTHPLVRTKVAAYQSARGELQQAIKTAVETLETD